MTAPVGPQLGRDLQIARQLQRSLLPDRPAEIAGILQSLTAKSPKGALSRGASAQPFFALPWTHYTLLLALKSEEARSFYEQEALRGG